MDSPSTPTIKPLSPSKAPLFPVSPERINQQKLTSSPSMPTDLLHLQQRSTDVQSKIAFINGLSRMGSPVPVQQSSSSASAALQRAILGREEAESALVRAISQLSEAQSRERRISERLESLLEELQTTKERQVHERSLYEKEIRKARKEAFKAGSVLVKIQEELKLSKGEVRSLKDEVRTEKEVKEKVKQESFERAYALAGLTEELQGLKDRLRSIEADNKSDALEARAKELHSPGNSPIERNINAQLTPTSRRPKRSVDDAENNPASSSHACLDSRDDETPSKKIRLSRRMSNKENQDPEAAASDDGLMEELRAELKWEQKLRKRAEDMIDFMKMECQFKQCSCRIAENQGHRYVHDKEWDKFIQQQQQKEELESKRTQPLVVSHESRPSSAHSPLGSPPPEAQHGQHTKQPVAAESALMHARFPSGSPPRSMTPPTPPDNHCRIKIDKERDGPGKLTMTFCPATGTFRAATEQGIDQRLQEEPLVLPRGCEPDEHSLIPSESHSPLPKYDPEPQGKADFQSFQARLVFEEEQSKPAAQVPFQTASESTGVEFVTLKEPKLEPFAPTEEVHTIVEQFNVKTVPLLPEDRGHVILVPGTPLTREQALAQIRERRGRARSMVKRSASTSEASVRSTGRIPGFHSADTRSEPDVGDRRDISAPVRPFKKIT